MTHGPGPAPATPGARASANATDRHETRELLVAKVQAITARWHQRQRETMEALTALQHALILSRDPVRTAEVWIDWYRDALQRLAEEAQDQRDISLALARTCGDGRLLAPGDSGDDPGAQYTRAGADTAASSAPGGRP